jgi:tetratricopeptide (TPR) repeat protein
MRKSLLVPLVLTLAGCLPGAKKPKNPTAGPPPGALLEMEPLKITATTKGGEVRSEAYDAKSLFEEASEAFNAGDYVTAQKKFTRVFSEFETSPYADPARYNAALSLESQEKWAEALSGYEQLLAKSPGSIEGRMRMSHCLARLERFGDALAALTPLDSRSDLDAQRLIELHARKSEGLFKTGDFEASAKESAQALGIYEDIKDDEPLETDYYISMAQYYDGKAIAERGRALPIRVNSGKKMLEQDLDDKAEFLLKAQASYVKVLKIGNRQFATMAGYEIGLLYEEFYRQIQSAPMPDELKDEEEKKAYQELLATETRVLLEKALRIYEKNVLLGERVGLKNDFVKQSATHIEAIKTQLGLTGGAQPEIPVPAPEEPKKKLPKGKKGDFAGGTKG